MHTAMMTFCFQGMEVHRAEFPEEGISAGHCSQPARESESPAGDARRMLAVLTCGQ